MLTRFEVPIEARRALLNALSARKNQARLTVPAEVVAEMISAASPSAASACRSCTSDSGAGQHPDNRGGGAHSDHR